MAATLVVQEAVYMWNKLRTAISTTWERSLVAPLSIAAPPAKPIEVENWTTTPAEAAKRPNWKKWVMIGSFTALGVAVAVVEVRTSWLQSKLFTTLLKGASWKVGTGEASHHFSTGRGPYDERLGYTRLGEMVDRAKQYGFSVQRQAHWSPRMIALGNYGIFPVYQEKPQGGIRILDRNGNELHGAQFPAATFAEFATLAPLVVKTALFIENREILDSRAPTRNPAIEWDRLAKAFVDFGVKKVSPGHQISGGSTLATQLEKVRHSPAGRTDGLVEKARQITSASFRAYQTGPTTMETRRRIVRDYINSLPLAATPAHGEIIGLADGLAAWYRTDPDRVNRLLMADEGSLTADEERERAAAYRQVLSLLLAINRPTYYLRQHPEALSERAEAYLRVMASEGLITPRLRDLAIASKVKLTPVADFPSRAVELDRKGTDAVRVNLLNLLGLPSLYDLDRLDLTVHTTLHNEGSTIAAQVMEQLNDPQFAAQNGLVGEKLLATGQGESVIYSLTLFERGENRNRLIVQLDSARQALNLNEGSKLELGSTAKLRTLASYLETVAALHKQFVVDKAPLPADPDKLSTWAVEYRDAATDRSLDAMLEAAMLREYSASPYEAFWTGGGVHAFNNFDSSDNGRRLTVREGFRRSVNLVFIRIMRDLVDYHMHRLDTYSPGLFADENHPLRQKLLARFADREGSAFMRGFYTKYSGLTQDEMLDKLFSEREISPSRFAVMYRTVRPGAAFGEFQLAMAAYVKDNVTEKRQQDLYDMYGPGKFTWNDRGYVATVHPLELWLVNYLQTMPEASWEQARDSSRYIRQEVYRWLFTSKSKHGQDLRIRSVLEVDAFNGIYTSWKKQGFPFRYLVPSLATSIGSSGDTPAALADLAGVILNEGVRYPNARIERLHFASGTPFETLMSRSKEEPTRVMPVEIARRLRKEMSGVVEFGTARRAFHSVKDAKGQFLEVGGKTGTGDNRTKSLWRVGRARNRTAAFVFMIGDRYFGTLVAYVPGEQAAGYRFSSALPVSVFKLIVPKVIEKVEAAPVQVPLVAAAPPKPAELR
ncbi:MAG: transglycosylase domain-containing protein [Bryobacterales bacterium]|nr:transglycosylase domain-containing protein [Bryobacterales bacterium]